MSRKGAPFNCTYEGCTASFSRPDRLKIHLRTHTGERPFVCEYEECDKSYISSTALKRHEATHEGTFKCTVEGCFEILKTKETLQKHVDFFHHKKKHKLYKCSECDKEFNKHNWLQRHMYRHTGIFPHKCPYEDCGKGFLLPSKLKVHIKTHKGHLCKTPGCEKIFYKWSLYVAHLKENHPAVHKCEFCKKEFSTSSNLKTHLKVHKLPPRKVFTCEEPNCPRFYYEEKNLKWHVMSYHAARPHACDKEHCHRAFKTKEALKEHLLRHVRRKPRKAKDITFGSLSSSELALARVRAFMDTTVNHEQTNKSDEQMNEFYEQMNESDEQTNESDEQANESDEQMNESDEQMDESDEQTNESDEQPDESNEQTNESDDRLSNADLTEKEAKT